MLQLHHSKLLIALVLGVLLGSCEPAKDRAYHYRNTLFDWAQLQYYKKANSTLKAPSATENRIVFMGNSITEGWRQTRPEFFAQKPYINRGIGGQTTPQMLVRFRQDVVDLQPKIVFLLAGTNDIAGNTGPTSLKEIADNLKSMCEIAKANGIKAVLCSVLPAEDYPWEPGKDPKHKIPALNSLLKEYAAANGVYYLDYFTALNNGRNGIDAVNSYDGVHLTAAGYQVLEPMVESVIEELLGQP